MDVLMLRLFLLLTSWGCVLSLHPIHDHQEFYEYDGVGNNIQNPLWGAASTNRLRQLPALASYLDGISVPRTQDTVSGLPSARRIMELLFRKAQPHKNKRTNQLLVEFGLFVTTDATKSAGAGEQHSLPIPCDGELVEYKWCPVTGKNYSIPFQRTIHTQLISTRQSINLATSYLDLSNIYGMNEDYAKEVLLQKGGLLPLDDQGLPRLDDKGKYMIADSKRATLSPGVFSLFTIFMRYHNLRAKEYARLSSNQYGDWELFQRARMDTIAVFQSIVEEKYIPSILGKPLDTFKGYNASINSAVDVFFSTVAMRYGHSALAGVIRVVDSNFQPTPRDPILLRDAILKVTSVLQDVGGAIEPILRGLVIHSAKAVDASVVDDLNIHNAASVFDIQRGRDSGIPPYNQVRQAFGLNPITSYEELLGTPVDPLALEALKELYGPNGIDQIDAIVGGLLEPIPKDGSLLGPVFTQSLQDQYQRLRDGDRLWYKNYMDAAQIEALPTLSDLIQLVSVENEEMENFPSDSFLTFQTTGTEQCPKDQTISLISGNYELSWDIQHSSDSARSLDLLIVVNERMEGPGYIGFGLNSQTMKDAEILFCRVEETVFDAYDTPETCETDPTSQPQMFSCCPAAGNHFDPKCASDVASTNNKVEVKGWCMSDSKVELRLSLALCKDEATTNNETCFEEENGSIDFIAAYNLLSVSAHGPNARASGSINLLSGATIEGGYSVNKTGFFAAHGLFMLFTWMVLVPVSMYIARYMKTRSIRIVAHISLMGCVGSLLVPVVTSTTVLVSETSNKAGEHRLVGLFLVFGFCLMAITGKLRLMVLQGRQGCACVFAVYFHRFLGPSLMLLGFWNCYTGLVRIGPQANYVELFTVNSASLGYNVNFFGTLRTIFWPYVGCIIIIFAAAEFQGVCWKFKRGPARRSESIWGCDDDTSYIERISLKTFLERTGNGRELCIVDGRVIDLKKIQEFHPGGPSVLRFAQGTDITEEILGRRDVDGILHTHSPAAQRLLGSFVTAIIDEPSAMQRASNLSISQASLGMGGPTPQYQEEQPFNRARVVGLICLTPTLARDKTEKQKVLLRLALKSSDCSEYRKSGGPCTYVFRSPDSSGEIVERQFTPLILQPAWKGNPYALFSSTHDMKDHEFVVDFLISLLPGGKMSKCILSLQPGSSLLVQGPRINPDVKDKIAVHRWKSMVMFVGGTGIASALQVAEYYLDGLQHCCPSMLLVWVLENRNHSFKSDTGIEELSQRSNGRFKWIVLYSQSPDQEDAKSEKSQGTSASGFFSLSDRSGRFEKLDPVAFMEKAAREDWLLEPQNLVFDAFESAASVLPTRRTSLRRSLRRLGSKSSIGQPEGLEGCKTSDADWDTWRNGNVFLDGSLDSNFISGALHAAATDKEPAPPKANEEEPEIVLPGEEEEPEIVLPGEEEEPEIVLPGEEEEPEIVLPGEEEEPEIVLPREEEEPEIILPPFSEHQERQPSQQLDSFFDEFSPIERRAAVTSTDDIERGSCFSTSVSTAMKDTINPSYKDLCGDEEPKMAVTSTPSYEDLFCHEEPTTVAPTAKKDLGIEPDLPSLHLQRRSLHLQRRWASLPSIQPQDTSTRSYEDLYCDEEAMTAVTDTQSKAGNHLSALGVLVCGPPSFDAHVLRILGTLGLNSEQVVSFGSWKNEALTEPIRPVVGNRPSGVVGSRPIGDATTDVWE